ncbi:MFS transporter [Vibrio sp. qd031]|uniref:multidrug effflux MFS transporter n=1 Tax=Vibrio sp. qd031 TaxID=1603038 RepID=UPI000A0F4E55|nr:multidrug effflux MFS transporter [Vibrio sp. qd031]ORT52785.1 MFS transporter [Vibrio sp. qd031]
MTQKAPIYLFLLLIIVSPMGIDIFLPALPQMADNLHTSMINVQSTIPIFLAALGMGQLFAGPLADRYGRKPMIFFGLMLYIVGAVVGSMALQIEVLWFARVLQGLGTCAVSVGVMSGVRDSYSAERSATIYSYINGVICVIPALAPLVGGWLSETWSWRSTFYFMTGYAVFVMLIALWKLPETRPQNTIVQHNLINWGQYKPIIHNPTFRFNVGLVMLAMAIIIAFVSIAPQRLMVELGLSPTAFSVWFGSNAIINIIASFTAPMVIARLGKDRALQLAIGMCTLAAVLLVTFSHIAHPFAFMGPVFIASTGFCIVLAICCGAALAPFAQRAGTASSLMGFFQMAGASVVVAAIGALSLSSVHALALAAILPIVWYGIFKRRSKLQQATH